MSTPMQQIGKAMSYRDKLNDLGFEVSVNSYITVYKRDKPIVPTWEYRRVFDTVEQFNAYAELLLDLILGEPGLFREICVLRESADKFKEVQRS